MDFDDLEEEVVNTKITKPINKEEKPDLIANSKHSRLTKLTILEQEYMFEEKLKEGQRLKTENGVKQNNELVSKEKDKETNSLITIKEKEKSCLIIINDDIEGVNGNSIIESNTNKLEQTATESKINSDNKDIIAKGSLQDNFREFMKKRKVKNIFLKSNNLY